MARDGASTYVPPMHSPEVLVLHGSPGSGKTTLARAVSELLRASEVAHGVIDLDDLNMVYPFQPRTFARDNLKAIWPNYAAVEGLKLILPTVIADREELDQLRATVPGARFLVCELTAPEAALKARVTEREPNAYWQEKLRDFVDLFLSRTDLEEIRDFAVSTQDRSIRALSPRGHHQVRLELRVPGAGRGPPSPASRHPRRSGRPCP